MTAGQITVGVPYVVDFIHIGATAFYAMSKIHGYAVRNGGPHLEWRNWYALYWGLALVFLSLHLR